MNLSPMFDPNQEELDLGVPTRYENRRAMIQGRVRGQRHRELVSHLLATSQFGDHVLQELPLIYGVGDMRKHGENITGIFLRRQTPRKILVKVHGDHGLLKTDDRDLQSTLVHEVAHAHDADSGHFASKPSREGFATGVEIAHYGEAGTGAYEHPGYWTPEQQSEYDAAKESGLTGKRPDSRPLRSLSSDPGHVQLRLF